MNRRVYEEEYEVFLYSWLFLPSRQDIRTIFFIIEVFPKMYLTKDYICKHSPDNNYCSQYDAVMSVVCTFTWYEEDSEVSVLGKTSFNPSPRIFLEKDQKIPKYSFAKEN